MCNITKMWSCLIFLEFKLRKKTTNSRREKKKKIIITIREKIHLSHEEYTERRKTHGRERKGPSERTNYFFSLSNIRFLDWFLHVCGGREKKK